MNKGYVVKITRADIEYMGDGDVEVLVRVWGENGQVSADTRPAHRGVWLPVEVNGGTVEEVKV